MKLLSLPQLIQELPFLLAQIKTQNNFGSLNIVGILFACSIWKKITKRFYNMLANIRYNQYRYHESKNCIP